MKILRTITDEDIFPEGILKTFDKPEKYEDRVAVKIVIFNNENKIALAGTRYRLLPGGGVEAGETLVDAVLRESREEVGCDLKNLEEFAVTGEFKKKRGYQVTHFFSGEVSGRIGKPETTQEDEQGGLPLMRRSNYLKNKWKQFPIKAIILVSTYARILMHSKHFRSNKKAGRKNGLRR